MKKLMFLFVILFTAFIYSQTTPSSYTDHLGLRLYAGNTGTINPGKDSLDQNCIDIDDGVKAIYDTLGTVKGDLYYHHNYDGTHKDGTIAWDKLSTAAKTMIVQTSSSQTITGNKTFNDMIGFGTTGIIKFGTFDGASAIEGMLYRTNSTSNTLPLWATSDSGDIDTLTTREWVRDNYSTSTFYYDKILFVLNTAMTEDTAGTGGAGTIPTDQILITGWFLNGVEGITQEFDYIAQGSYLKCATDDTIKFKAYVYLDNFGTDIVYDYAYLRFYVGGTYVEHDLLGVSGDAVTIDLGFPLSTYSTNDIVSWRVYGYLRVNTDGTQTSNDMHVRAPQIYVKSRLEQ